MASINDRLHLRPRIMTFVIGHGQCALPLQGVKPRIETSLPVF